MSGKTDGIDAPRGVQASVLPSRESANSAAQLLSKRPIREVVLRDPRLSVRWHNHDYPSPLARWNRHPEYEIHLINASYGHYIVGDHIGTFGPGQLVMVGPDLPHDWISELKPGHVIPKRDVVLQFRDEWLDACMSVLPELEDLRYLRTRATRGIEYLGDTARYGGELLRHVGSARGADRVARVFELLAHLNDAPELEQRSLSNFLPPRPLDGGDADVIGRALHEMSTNLATGVSLETTARRAGMSTSAFSKHFKRATGQTFTEVVKRMRLSHACRLLAHTTMPVAQIARTAGYSNLSNFNRLFLEAHDCTPREYRAEKGPGAQTVTDV